jgi:hypothetical protein
MILQRPPQYSAEIPAGRPELPRGQIILDELALKPPFAPAQSEV